MRANETIGHRLGVPGGPGCEVAGLEVTIGGAAGKRVPAELLDAGTAATELELLRTVASRLGAHWGLDEFGWWAVIESAKVSDWSVWRQDDSGNRFLIVGGLSERTARNRVAEFEASAHKQTYWAERA